MLQDYSLVKIYKLLRDFRSMCMDIINENSTLSSVNMSEILNEKYMYDQAIRCIYLNYNYRWIFKYIEYYKYVLHVNFGISIENNNDCLFNSIYNVIHDYYVAESVLYNPYTFMQLREIYVTCCLNILKLFENKQNHLNDSILDLYNSVSRYKYVIPYYFNLITYLHEIVRIKK